MDDSHQPGPAAGLTRHVLFAAGSVSLALGITGVFVPLLPTTPFLLLAAACYIRSSPRAYRWLVGNRVLGAYIRGYRSGAGLPLSVKLITLCVLWITIGYSALYVIDSAWIRIGLGAVAIGVTGHILAIRTAVREPRSKRELADQGTSG